MASIISAGTTSATALNMSADTSGVLQLASNNGTVALTVSTSQNVGIGTTSPNGKLSVLSPSTAQAIAIWNRTSDNTYGGIYFKTSDGSNDQTTILNERAGTNGAGLLFYTKPDGGSIVETARIDTYGNTILGGTTGLGASGGRLAVYGTSGGQNGFIQVTNPGYGTGVIGVQGTSSNLKIYNSYSTGTFSGGVGIDINTSGYIGLNTTSPAYLLDVRGSTIFASNGSASAGNEYTFINGGDRYILTHGTSLNTATQMYFTNPNGTVGSISTSGTSTSYNTSSDYRLKNNVQPMQNALEKVAALRPVTFTWNTDGTEGEGFIAHELQTVVPIAVYGEKDAVEDYGDVFDSEGNLKYPDVRTPTTPEEGTIFIKKGERPVYQSVDTSHLVATLTAAIQELNAKVTALENK